MGQSTRWAGLTLVAAIIFAGMVSLSACSPTGMPGGMGMHGGRDARGDELVAGSDSVDVDIQDYAFEPGNLRVTAGTTVTWTNRDGDPHTATADGNAWTTELLREDQSGSVTFDEAGVYEYYCQPHPDMRARIEVTT